MTPEQVVRSLYDAFTRGDFEEMEGYMHPEITWHVEAPSPLEGTREGRDAVHATLVDRFGSALRGTRAEVQDLVAEDVGRVVARVRFVAGSDEGVSLNTVHIFQVADDLITEMWFHPLTEESVQRFWDEITGGDAP